MIKDTKDVEIFMHKLEYKHFKTPHATYSHDAWLFARAYKGCTPNYYFYPAFFWIVWGDREEINKVYHRQYVTARRKYINSIKEGLATPISECSDKIDWTKGVKIKSEKSEIVKIELNENDIKNINKEIITYENMGYSNVTKATIIEHIIDIYFLEESDY